MAGKMIRNFQRKWKMSILTAKFSLFLWTEQKQSREGRRGGERRGEEMRGKAQESRKEGIVMFREWHEWKRFPLVVCSRLAVVTR